MTGYRYAWITLAGFVLAEKDMQKDNIVSLTLIDCLVTITLHSHDLSIIVYEIKAW